MDIMNGSYAQTHFPCKLWDAGEKGLTIYRREFQNPEMILKFIGFWSFFSVLFAFLIFIYVDKDN